MLQKFLPTLFTQVILIIKNNNSYFIAGIKKNFNSNYLITKMISNNEKHSKRKLFLEHFNETLV